jgi:Family of unknown function (DUF6527)
LTVTGFDPHEDSATFLDERHAYRYVHGTDATQPIGLIESHQLPDGRWCEGSVMFKGRGGGSPEWAIVLEDPLTLTPSILCRTCGSHGYIEGGRWREA